MSKNNFYVRLQRCRILDIFVLFPLFILNTSRANLLSANAAFPLSVSASARGSELTNPFQELAGTRNANMSFCIGSTRNVLLMKDISPTQERRDVRVCSGMQAIYFNRCRGGTEAPMSTLSSNEAQHFHPAHRQQHKYQRELILKLTEGL